MKISCGMVRTAATNTGNSLHMEQKTLRLRDIIVVAVIMIFVQIMLWFPESVAYLAKP
jgi:hypothetical protein